MTAYRAIRLRLYPNQEQSQALVQNIGARRWLYNRALAVRIKAYQESGENLSAYDFSRMLPALKEKYLWLKTCDSVSLQQALRDLDQAYANFFRRVRKGENPGFPKFQRKGVRESFRCLNAKVDAACRKIKIGKHGWISARGSRSDLNLLSGIGKIKRVTVIKEGSSWYASCLTSAEQTPWIHKYPVCGVDVGVSRPVVIAYLDDQGELLHKSTGKSFSVALAKKEKRRIRYQRALSRKTCGSGNRLKAKLKVQKSYQREKNFRKDFIEKVSHKLASTFEVVKFERLPVQLMVGKAKGKKALNRGLLRLGIAQIMLRTEQKALRYQGSVIYVDPCNTSRECSVCHHVSKYSRKSQAVFRCVICGHLANADDNASTNILFKEAA